MNKEELIKFLKNKNNVLILIILIIGVVIMVSSAGRSKPQTVTTSDTFKEEEELGRILSDIEGAGEVSVMITYYGTTEKDIAYETKTSSSDGTNSSEDKKAVMSGGTPMVVKEIYPKVKGVIITAQGAGNAAVKRRLTEAVTAALDVPEYRVCICQSKE
jgi:stage III sporulation protein AG